MFLHANKGIFIIIIYLNKNAETVFFVKLYSVRNTQAQNKTVNGTQYEGVSPLNDVITHNL